MLENISLLDFILLKDQEEEDVSLNVYFQLLWWLAIVRIRQGFSTNSAALFFSIDVNVDKIDNICSWSEEIYYRNITQFFWIIC